jgi:NADH:ubiquinone oxidoreductase subunit 6 (subunit J)
MPDSPSANTTGTSPLGSLISRINDVLATRVTVFVGTMWAFYVFVIFGLTPLMWPEHEEQILYWSNFLQLVFLPVITVGTAIMNRATEARAASDHKKIRKEFKLLKETHAELSGSLQEISRNIEELLKRTTPG